MKPFPSGRRRCQNQLSFRRGKRVSRQKTILSPWGDTSYYLCPSCGILLKREFVRYCDACGQKLNWRAVLVRFKKSALSL